MAWHVWLAYFAAAWLIALSPGSGAVLAMSHGLSYGVRRTTATIVGLQLGLAFIFLVAGVGVGALLLASATAFTVIKVLGAAYLVWLGLRQWRAPLGALQEDGQVAAGPVPSVRRRIALGLFTNATNPKGIVFMAAVLPQFINPKLPLAPQLAILLATTVVVDLIVMHGYAFLASRLRAWLRTARARRGQNRVFGGVLMAMGASLLLVDRVARAG